MIAPATRPGPPSWLTATPAERGDGLKRYRVTMPGHEPREVVTVSRPEAWALYCDACKSWPNPKTVGIAIEYLGPAT